MKRLILGVTGHVTFAIACTLLLLYCIKLVYGVAFSNPSTILSYTVSIALLITLVLSSRKFLLSWRQLAIDTEKIKKESVAAQYETLKNQVNPHFLFNSLNALTTLVYENQDTAADFIKKLSEVYRYVLETKDQALVALTKEMSFVSSYVFLQKIRFEENLNFNINIKPTENYSIAPLSIQMLVENAIKHNIISNDQPLEINIFIENDYLVVANNLQKKNILKEESSKTGMSNIVARYSFLTDRKVEIIEGKALFTVKLPIVKS